MAETQISAYISDTTRDEFERYVEAHGLRKGALVEQALLHHLQELRRSADGRAGQLGDRREPLPMFLALGAIPVRMT